MPAEGVPGCCCWTGGRERPRPRKQPQRGGRGVPEWLRAPSQRWGPLSSVPPASQGSQGSHGPTWEQPPVPSTGVGWGWGWGWPQASSQQALAEGSWNHPESSSLLWLPCVAPHTDPVLAPAQLQEGTDHSKADDALGPSPLWPTLDTWMCQGCPCPGAGKARMTGVWAGVGHAGPRCGWTGLGILTQTVSAWSSHPRSGSACVHTRATECTRARASAPHTPRSCLLYGATGPCPRRPREAIT